MKRIVMLTVIILAPWTCLAIPHVTTLQRLNLRKAPRVADNVLRTLDTGTHLRVIGSRGDWLQVRTPAEEVGWVKAAYVAPPPPAPPIIDKRVKCEMARSTGNLYGEYLHFVQGFAVAYGRPPMAVSERFSISSLNVLGSSGPSDDAYSRFVDFVRSLSGRPCGPADYRDPYERVPNVDVIESPDVVARVGRCKIRRSVRLFNGFDEYAYQGTVTTPAGTETAASNRYSVSAENVFMGDAPLAGDIWALVEHVKSELRRNERCDAPFVQ